MSPCPPNTDRKGESLRTLEAKFELLVSIHGAKEIGDNKVKMMPYGSREITILNIVEKSLFMVITTTRTSRRRVIHRWWSKERTGTEL
jgi:hypothetical protein